jgi:hypothetical protein
MVESIKLDEGKLKWSLLPLESIQEVIKVLMFGETKYSTDNWKNLKDAKSRYYDAAMRHLTAWKLGAKTDPESGLSHLAHAACCILFMTYFESKK